MKFCWTWIAFLFLLLIIGVDRNFLETQKINNKIDALNNRINSIEFMYYIDPNNTDIVDPNITLKEQKDV